MEQYIVNHSRKYDQLAIFTLQTAREGCGGEYRWPSNSHCANSLQDIQEVSDSTDHKCVDYPGSNARHTQLALAACQLMTWSAFLACDTVHEWLKRCTRLGENLSRISNPHPSQAADVAGSWKEKANRVRSFVCVQGKRLKYHSQFLLSFLHFSFFF